MYQSPMELAIRKGENIYLHGDQGVTEKIKRAMYDVAKQFVYIGFLLWEVKEYDYYSQSGYKDVYDYAEKELGFKRTSTKNFISITEVFGSQQSMHELEDGVFRKQGEYRPSMNIQQEYRNFKYSQLCEMLSMSEKQRELVTPDMTIKEIRSLKQPEPPQEAASDSSDPNQTSDQEIDFKTLDKVIAIAKSQTSDQEQELLPCPFCGGKAEYHQFANPINFYSVTCSICRCSTDGFYNNKSDNTAKQNKNIQAAIWNLRY